MVDSFGRQTGDEHPLNTDTVCRCPLSSKPIAQRTSEVFVDKFWHYPATGGCYGCRKRNSPTIPSCCTVYVDDKVRRRHCRRTLGAHLNDDFRRKWKHCFWILDLQQFCHRANTSRKAITGRKHCHCQGMAEGIGEVCRPLPWDPVNRWINSSAGRLDKQRPDRHVGTDGTSFELVLFLAISGTFDVFRVKRSSILFQIRERSNWTNASSVCDWNRSDKICFEVWNRSTKSLQNQHRVNAMLLCSIGGSSLSLCKRFWGETTWSIVLETKHARWKSVGRKIASFSEEHASSWSVAYPYHSTLQTQGWWQENEKCLTSGVFATNARAPLISQTALKSPDHIGLSGTWRLWRCGWRLGHDSWQKECKINNKRRVTHWCYWRLDSADVTGQRSDWENEQ